MADEGSTKNNIILILILVMNMVAMSLFGLYLVRQHRNEVQKTTQAEQSKKTAAADSADAASPGNTEQKENNSSEDNPYTVKVVKFEGLITNLASPEGRRMVRISLEAKFEGDGILNELKSLKPKVRDIILVDVGNSSAEALSSNEGKEQFKSYLSKDINAILKKGKVVEIYITDLELN